MIAFQWLIRILLSAIVALIVVGCVSISVAAAIVYIDRGELLKVPLAAISLILVLRFVWESDDIDEWLGKITRANKNGS